MTREDLIITLLIFIAIQVIKIDWNVRFKK